MSKFHDNYLKKLLPTEFSGKKSKNFFLQKILICGKVASLSEKMMIYHKNS